jgi:hypothetical protein
MGRHPKPFTKGDIPALCGHVRFAPDSDTKADID